jgi:hypothetical protein
MDNTKNNNNSNSKSSLRSSVVFLSLSGKIPVQYVNQAMTATFQIPSNSSFTTHPAIKQYIV